MTQSAAHYNIVNVLMCFKPQLAKHEWAKNADMNKKPTERNKTMNITMWRHMTT